MSEPIKIRLCRRVVVRVVVKAKAKAKAPGIVAHRYPLLWGILVKCLSAIRERQLLLLLLLLLLLAVASGECT